MKRIVLLPAALLLGTGSLLAQSETDLNRRMEVTRDYEPTVGQAVKIGAKPDMTDTMTLRPELRYGIGYRPVEYGFETTPIRPVSVDLNQYRSMQPLYIKAGIGVPLQSLLDVYYNAPDKTDGRFSAYLNHYGSWSKIKNDLQVKTPASQTFNSAGITGEHRFGRLSISGEAGVDFDKISKYGWYIPNKTTGEDPGASPEADTLNQHYTTVRGRFDFGHAFEDLSYFNFRLGAEVAYFTDRFKQTETDFTGRLDLGKLFGDRHEVTLRLKYRGFFGSRHLDYRDHMTSVTPMYRLLNTKIHVKFGCTFTYDKTEGGPETPSRSKGHFFPLVEARFDIADGHFTPFVEIDGQLVNNGYRSISSANPYIVPGFHALNTAEYNGRAGITGSISSSFSYKVYGGVSRYQDMRLFANYYPPVLLGVPTFGNEFVCLSDDVTMWTAGGEIEGRVSGSFGIEAGVQYKHYDTSDGIESGLPSLTARLGLNYNYRDKLSIRLGGELYGKRTFSNATLFGTEDIPANSIGTKVDLHLGGEYRISRKLGVFLDLNNLLDQRLYLFNRYPTLGFNVLAGVKLSF